MAWIDIILIVVLVIAAIAGLSRGFLRSLLALFGTLVTLIISIFLAKPFAGMLESLFGMTTALGNALVDPLTPYFEGGNNLPYILNALGGILGLDMTNVEGFAHGLGNVLAMVISAVILFIIIKIVLSLLAKLFDTITSKSTAISGLDHILGFIIGAAKGLVVVMLIFALVYVISPVIPAFNDTINSWLEINPVTNTIYNWTRDILENVIIPFFSK